MTVPIDNRSRRTDARSLPAHLWCGLFGTRSNTIITIVTTFLLWQLVPPLVRWAVLDATFTGTSDACVHDGACWAFVGAKLRFILFAFYPPDLQWRPLLVILVLAMLLIASAVPRFWGWKLLTAWPVSVVLCWLLMEGAFSATPVPSNQWGRIAGHAVRLGGVFCRRHAHCRVCWRSHDVRASVGSEPFLSPTSKRCGARRWWAFFTSPC